MSSSTYHSSMSLFSLQSSVMFIHVSSQHKHLTSALLVFSFPQEEAPSRRSVAELAGRFKGSAAPHDAAAASETVILMFLKMVEVALILIHRYWYSGLTLWLCFVYQEKPVRRRPPRSLHIPKAQGDEQEVRDKPGIIRLCSQKQNKIRIIKVKVWMLLF